MLPTRIKTAVVALLLIVATLPTLWVLVAIFGSLLELDNQHLPHLLEHVLPTTLVNTLRLLLVVLPLAALFGIASAWLCVNYRFPGSKVFGWAMFLPMAMPGYIMAFAFTGLHEQLVQSLHVRQISLAWLPAANSFPVVALVFALVLYPYVFLLARGAFMTQGRQLIEVGQSLGYSSWGVFFRIALPSARPWIFAGLLLVAMETLADFGTVAVFNYDTFTTAIYKAWYGLYSVTTGLQLAAGLLVLVAVVLLVEARVRRAQRFYQRDIMRQPLSPRLSGWQAFAATAFCGLILGLGFVLPVVQLLLWTLQHAANYDFEGFLALVWMTVKIAMLAVLVLTALATLLVLLVRFSRLPLRHVFLRIASLGYALPGTVLAIALYSGFGSLAALLAERGFAVSWLQGSIVLMLVALAVRFLAVALQPIESNMARITPSIEQAARSLGADTFSMLRRLHIPLLRTGLLTAMLLVFVDVIKELPITLMTRPFGVNTLAVKVYEYSSEGLWEQAALPALAIVAVGLVPIYLLIKLDGRR